MADTKNIPIQGAVEFCSFFIGQKQRLPKTMDYGLLTINSGVPVNCFLKCIESLYLP